MLPYVFRARWTLFGMVLAVLINGCASPAEYRRQADHEVSRILQQKGGFEQWLLMETSADPPVCARYFDPVPADCPPMPPDDPVAHAYMHCPADQPGYRHWHDDGDAVAFENDHWREYLETTESGAIALSSETAFELALVNNRQFQSALEDVYLTALTLTLERFEFDLQWFGGNTTEYAYAGPETLLGERDQVLSTSFLGFSRNFAAGGQLLVNFANTLVWDFNGSKSNLATSALAIDFVQPLLRGAFRDVRLESLTQAERNVLYAVRDFARFRKRFYVDVVAGEQGYLSLLLNLQAIRNLEQNLEALEQNLRAHEALAEAGIVSPLQVDQVFQSYQAGRLSLIRARNNLQNSLDTYKLLLGVPPETPVELNDAQLERFEFTSADVNRLEVQINQLLETVRESNRRLDTEQRINVLQSLLGYMEGILSNVEVVELELRRWEQRATEDAENDDEIDARERRDQLAMRERLDDLRRAAMRLTADVEQALEGATAEDLGQWEVFVRAASTQISDLFVIQTQVRTYLIELRTLEVTERRAVELALDRRLDLMNGRGMVVDAWRKIRVAQDALEADLDLFVDADIATPFDSTNPVDFSSDASSYRVGASFDGPLNRLAERNTYRAELINYQRSRRQLIGLRDNVVQAVRRDLRALEAEQLNFEISRQSLIAAARQVEIARVQLLAPDQAGDSSTTQDALNALNSLLAAKNSLIAAWVSYETARMQLLLDIESLDLDQYGQIGNENFVGDSSSREAVERRQQYQRRCTEPLTGSAGRLEDAVGSGRSTARRPAPSGESSRFAQQGR